MPSAQDRWHVLKSYGKAKHEKVTSLGPGLYQGGTPWLLSHKKLCAAMTF